MKNFYALFFLLFFVSANYAQQSPQTLVVDKAWLNEEEEWSDFTYAGQIIFSTNPTAEEGSLRIGNYDFLYDFCDEKLNLPIKQLIALQNLHIQEKYLLLQTSKVL